jgi:hypothetical protein
VLAKPARVRAEKSRVKVDPNLIAAARELRDRYLEHVNDGGGLPPAPNGRYDVSRTLGGPAVGNWMVPLLKAG